MRHTRTVLTDDITGQAGDDVQTVTFHDADGRAWSLDLCDYNREYLNSRIADARSLLAWHVDRARPVTAPRKPRTGNPDAAHARAWWNQRDDIAEPRLADRGRIPAHVWDAWHQAGNPKVGA